MINKVPRLNTLIPLAEMISTLDIITKPKVIRAFGMTHTTVVYLFNFLIRNNYLQQTDGFDDRTKVYQITDHGRTAFNILAAMRM